MALGIFIVATGFIVHPNSPQRPLYFLIQSFTYMKIRKEALWACFAMDPNIEAMITVS